MLFPLPISVGAERLRRDQDSRADHEDVPEYVQSIEYVGVPMERVIL